MIYIDVGSVAMLNSPAVLVGDNDNIEYAVLKHQPVDLRKGSHHNISHSAAGWSNYFGMYNKCIVSIQ